MNVKSSDAHIPSDKTRKILVVDDATQLAEVVTHCLQKAGYEVSVAHDAETALTMACRFIPDLVLLDLKLPGMDGFEVCHVLKEMEGTERPKILVMSSGGPKIKEDVEELLKNSLADGFLPKPFPVNELLNTVHSLLTHSSPTIIP